MRANGARGGHRPGGKASSADLLAAPIFSARARLICASALLVVFDACLSPLAAVGDMNGDAVPGDGAQRSWAFAGVVAAYLVRTTLVAK